MDKDFKLFKLESCKKRLNDKSRIHRFFYRSFITQLWPAMCSLTIDTLRHYGEKDALIELLYG